MRLETWTPIRENGSLDTEELLRPQRTCPEGRRLERPPTLWEVAFVAPTSTSLFLAVIGQVVQMAITAPTYRFRIVVAPAAFAKMPHWGPFGTGTTESPPANTIIAAGPIRTQAEADAVLPTLLAVKAARREAVFAPGEALDVARFLEPLEAIACIICGWPGTEYIRHDDYQWSEQGDLQCPECGHTSGAASMSVNDGGAIRAVRVRGGTGSKCLFPMSTAAVRALRDQAKGAGVDFSISWGRWVPIPSGDDGPNGHLFKHIDPDTWFAKSRKGGCALDGVDYPEEP